MHVQSSKGGDSDGRLAGAAAETGAGVAVKADATGVPVVVANVADVDAAPLPNADPAEAIADVAVANGNGPSSSGGAAAAEEGASAGAAGGGAATGEQAGGGRLTAEKHSAAGFDAEQKPLSTCILNGVDYSEARSLRVRAPSSMLLITLVTGPPDCDYRINPAGFL